MKWRQWFDSWNLKSVKLKSSILDMEFEPLNEDKNAAWELYIELSTRITTQPLPETAGDNLAALESVYVIFELTREILKKYNRSCIEFSKLAIPILNEMIRPFTAKWHPISKREGLNDKNNEEFKKDLKALQKELIVYTGMLGDMAGLESTENLIKLQYM